MGFLTLIFGRGRPHDPIPREEVERRLREHDQKIRELDDALHALRGDEPDLRERPHAT